MDLGECLTERKVKLHTSVNEEQLNQRTTDAVSDVEPEQLSGAQSEYSTIRNPLCGLRDGPFWYPGTEHRCRNAQRKDDKSNRSPRWKSR